MGAEEGQSDARAPKMIFKRTKRKPRLAQKGSRRIENETHEDQKEAQDATKGVPGGPG